MTMMVPKRTAHEVWPATASGAGNSAAASATGNCVVSCMAELLLCSWFALNLVLPLLSHNNDPQFLFPTGAKAQRTRHLACDEPCNSSVRLPPNEWTRPIS